MGLVWKNIIRKTCTFLFMVMRIFRKRKNIDEWSCENKFHFVAISHEFDCWYLCEHAALMFQLKLVLYETQTNLISNSFIGCV